MSACIECIQPSADGGSVPLDPQHSGSGAMNQDLAQVDVATLADTQQVRLASCRVLPWHDPEPGRELPALAESRSVADRSNDRYEKP